MRVPGGERVPGGVAHPYVKNGILVLLWLPFLIVFYGFAIGVAWGAVRYARTGDLSAVGTAIPTGQLALAAAGGSIAYVFLLLSTATFGSETVTETTEAAQDLKETAEDGGDGGDE